MNKKLLLGILLMVLSLALTGIVSAEDLYTFELSEAERVEDHAYNWYLDLSIPQVRGMADKEEQELLNVYFLSWRDYILEEYADDVEYALEMNSEENLPHFGYEYDWEKLFETDDVFVFKTWLYFAAGSSMTVNEYWTLNKHSGVVAELSDYVDGDRIEAIREMILDAMKQENEKQEVFWTDEDSFNLAFAYVEEYKHWYINENGNPVITFDKYEIAPGAFGESRFEITGEKAVLLKDQKYTFNLYVGDTVEDIQDEWYLKASLPVIEGLADIDLENEMNLHFKQMVDSIRKEYETAVATAEENVVDGEGPHFGYEYFYEILADTDDIFSFKTVSFFAAGSSMTSNEFWTLDKNTGLPVKFEDVLPAGGLDAVREQIFAEMTAANEAGNGLYYTDDDSLRFALANTKNYHHWYLNADGSLVIAFDKYEIAVGAQGTPEFVISR